MHVPPTVRYLTDGRVSLKPYKELSFILFSSKHILPKLFTDLETLESLKQLKVFDKKNESLKSIIMEVDFIIMIKQKIWVKRTCIPSMSFFFFC